MAGKSDLRRILIGMVVLGLCAVPRFSYADWSVGVGVSDGYHGGDHHDWDHRDWDHRDGDHRYHDWDHHEYRWHDHPDYGWHMHYIPMGYNVVWVGGTRYFYSQGLYYQYVGDGDYVLVNPPYGAYVTTIPPDFQAIDVNGRTYYTDHGVYYVLTPYGYKVVHQPVIEQVEVVQAQPVQQVVEQGTFPVNIPNGNGSYTTVVIKRSGNGYVGPQGEFYASFPSVVQLRAMYAK